MLVAETAATPYPRLSIVLSLEAVLQQSIMGCHQLNSSRGSSRCPIVPTGQRLLLLLSAWKKRPLLKTGFSIVIESIIAATPLTASFVRTLTCSPRRLASPRRRLARCFMVQPKPKAEVSFQRSDALLVG